MADSIAMITHLYMLRKDSTSSLCMNPIKNCFWIVRVILPGFPTKQL